SGLTDELLLSLSMSYQTLKGLKGSPLPCRNPEYYSEKDYEKYGYEMQARKQRTSLLLLRIRG
ncbi:MAG: hypothetical protein ACLR23_26245, partial [Clostridia bacterium]